MDRRESWWVARSIRRSVRLLVCLKLGRYDEGRRTDETAGCSLARPVLLLLIRLESKSKAPVLAVSTSQRQKQRHREEKQPSAVGRVFSWRRRRRRHGCRRSDRLFFKLRVNYSLRENAMLQTLPPFVPSFSSSFVVVMVPVFFVLLFSSSVLLFIFLGSLFLLHMVEELSLSSSFICFS